jgi:hypothetical protein
MTMDQMLKEKKYQEIWEKYCSFLDFSIDDFMEIQNRLLLEQISIYAKSELGQKIMNGHVPTSVDEFRKLVPLTSYEDYADMLLPKNKDVLPGEPIVWIQTTWEGGKAPIKVAPYTRAMIDMNREFALACCILSTSTKKGEFKLRPNMNFLNGMAPLPYLTGLLPYSIQGDYTVTFLPDIEEGNKMGFGERNKAGFKLGMQKGIDLFYGLSSIIVRMGESFVEGSSTKSKFDIFSYDMKMLSRLAKAKIRSKFSKQPMYPKDVFDLKGFVCAGTDSLHFKKKIEKYWGVKPLEIFGGTEACAIGSESWTKNGIILWPNICFYEFIPMHEFYKNLENPKYQPKTYLINELKADEHYEIVITTLKGGAFARYRIGDVFKCLSLTREEDGIMLPHFSFVDRIAPVIDLAGFTRITQGTINEVISLSKLDIHDWFAIKKFDVEQRPYVSMYIEIKHPKQGYGLDNVELIKDTLEIYFRYLDEDYKNLRKMLGIDPLQVHIIPLGTIKAYEASVNHKVFRVNPNYFDVTEMLKIASMKQGGETFATS